MKHPHSMLYAGCFMKENRIVLKGTNKRDAGGFLLFVFLLPYVCACLWGHVGVENEVLWQNQYHSKEAEGAERYVQAQMSWGTWEIPLEEYVVYKLESVMPDTYETEALKAQAVLVRTELVEVMAKEESGQLRVAPEHISDNVLRYMGKPSRKVYDRFIEKFEALNDDMQLNQYAVPYLMSSHPGSTMREAIRLAEYLNEHRITPEQVQDFYPTPGTISTCMYYTGLDPMTMKPVYVPKSAKEKAAQRALLQFRKPENYETVKKALIENGREDLIGFKQKCLIKPFKENLSKGKGDKNGNAAKGKGSLGKNKGRDERRGKGIKGKGNKSGTGGNSRGRGSGKSGVRKK